LASDDFEKIHVLNRASIVDDWLNLARAGLLDYEITLRGLQYLRHETNFLPFRSAFTGLDTLIRKFSTSPDYDIFKVSRLLIERLNRELISQKYLFHLQFLLLYRYYRKQFYPRFPWPFISHIIFIGVRGFLVRQCI
jgi:hypothetical protein